MSYSGSKVYHKSSDVLSKTGKVGLTVTLIAQISDLSTGNGPWDQVTTVSVSGKTVLSGDGQRADRPTPGQETLSGSESS